MEKYSIEWQGVSYPAIDLTIFEGTSEETNVTVSTIGLANVLMESMEKHIDADKAARVDERIAYYVELNEINLPASEIIKIVEEGYE